MNFEIVDNIFQILVLFCVMTASAVTACKKKSRDFLLLAGGYGCFMMGTLYYVLYLIIMGKVPQIFYVAEISWLAAYLFFLSLSLSRRDLHGKLPGVVSVLGAVVIVCLVMAFQIFGPSLFFFWLLWNYCRYHCPSVYGSAKKRKRTSFSGRNYAVSGMAAGIVVYCV